MEASSSKPRGALIVFEGIDRCGKTTQCAKLVEYLRSQGVDAQMWRFPDRTTGIGQTINDYLANKANMDDAVAHLLFVANRFEKRSEMLRLLAAGTTLVVDRYSYSGVAYTCAKRVPHLNPSYCRSVEVGLPAADLVLYMDISPEASAARGGYGGERYEKMDFQREVVAQFQALRDERWACISAESDIANIHRQIIAVAEPVVQRVAAGAPIQYLWEPLEAAKEAAKETAEAQQKATTAEEATAEVEIRYQLPGGAKVEEANVELQQAVPLST